MDVIKGVGKAKGQYLIYTDDGEYICSTLDGEIANEIKTALGKKISKQQLLKEFEKLHVDYEDCDVACDSCDYLIICDTIEQMFERKWDEEEWEQEEREDEE